MKNKWPEFYIQTCIQYKLHNATMMWNSQLTIGTVILQVIKESTKALNGHKSNANSFISKSFSLKWNYTKDSIQQFKKIFNELLNIVQENNPTFLPKNESVWINALLNNFSNLKCKHNEDNLDETWTIEKYLLVYFLSSLR